MKNQVLEILQETRPDIDFESTTDLVENGLLDSFDIVSIISELNDLFDIKISINELNPDNFHSLDTITEMCKQLQDEK